LTRPNHVEIGAWRAHVDDAVADLLQRADEPTLAALAPLVALGVAHEEQHQELIITDALHLLSRSPLAPALQAPTTTSMTPAAIAASWSAHGDGVFVIGRDLPRNDLVFDNEGPAHRAFVEPFAVRASLVTVGEVRAFVDEGGYRAPALWLAAGFDHVRERGLVAPAMWRSRERGAAVTAFTVHGDRALHDDEPATHLSYYEADAIARFLGARLPTEHEWEVAFGRAVVSGGFDVDEAGTVSDLAPRGHAPFGVCWQWTQSSYAAYPGFRPANGVVGEYNGKFMVGQQVLRGSSSYTPAGHARAAYRNFWPAPTTFQGTGVRLVRDA
jgi:ergothioneine biosynthesis protein EgtB